MRGNTELCFAGEAFENLEVQIVLYCHFRGLYLLGWVAPGFPERLLSTQ